MSESVKFSQEDDNMSTCWESVSSEDPKTTEEIETEESTNKDLDEPTQDLAEKVQAEESTNKDLDKSTQDLAEEIETEESTNKSFINWQFYMEKLRIHVTIVSAVVVSAAMIAIFTPGTILTAFYTPVIMPVILGVLIAVIVSSTINSYFSSSSTSPKDSSQENSESYWTLNSSDKSLKLFFGRIPFSDDNTTPSDSEHSVSFK